MITGATKNDDVAIYGLRFVDGDFFYVGSTTNPAKRLKQHCKRVGSDEIEMHVLRWVSVEERCIEEMREIVNQYDLGCALTNSSVPVLVATVPDQELFPAQPMPLAIVDIPQVAEVLAMHYKQTGNIEDKVKATDFIAAFQTHVDSNIIGQFIGQRRIYNELRKLGLVVGMDTRRRTWICGLRPL